jgi:hypothetical protein
MDALAAVLQVVGFIAGVVASIWLLVVAFQIGSGGAWPACSSPSPRWYS